MCLHAYLCLEEESLMDPIFVNNLSWNSISLTKTWVFQRRKGSHLLLGNSQSWDSPYTCKDFADSTRNIESIIKACTKLLFTYLSQFLPDSLPEVPLFWIAQLLSLPRVKAWLRELVCSWGKVKVRIQIPGSDSIISLFYYWSNSPWNASNLKKWL